MLNKNIYWEHFAHDADIGIRGVGETLSQAFEQTALAMTSVVSDIETIACIQKINFQCQADDHELLLVDWLNALIYQMATRRMLFSCFYVSIQDNQLHATIAGEPVNPERHHPAVEIKGATYTELKVCQQENGYWLAQCVVDV